MTAMWCHILPLCSLTAVQGEESGLAGSAPPPPPGVWLGFPNGILGGGQNPAWALLGQDLCQFQEDECFLNSKRQNYKGHSVECEGV